LVVAPDLQTIAAGGGQAILPTALFDPRPIPLSPMTALRCRTGLVDSFSDPPR